MTCAISTKWPTAARPPAGPSSCDAEVSGIHCLKQMVKTIRKRIEGLLAFWKHKGLTNARQEGFNNKIGWLTRQAYGYRDEAYLYIKIYDPPHLSTQKEL